MPHEHPTLDAFARLADAAPDAALPVFRRLMSDTLTPVLAYRRLVRDDDRMAPSFLLEAVVGGDRVGRYSYVGAQPSGRAVARGETLTLRDDRGGRAIQTRDPLLTFAEHAQKLRMTPTPGLPDFAGGWVGYVGYDTVRYVEREKLASPPPDDRGLPDIDLQFYRELIAFDHVQKTVLAVTHVVPSRHPSPREAYEAATAALAELARRVQTPRDETPELRAGDIDLETPAPALPLGNMKAGQYQDVVRRIKKYIAAGDVFQVVPSQRFELETPADPFDVYRALRVINPSPYMFYLQFEGGILVGASPEILCRVQDGLVVNRPLAGTRRRTGDPQVDTAAQRELLADAKERAEHIMLVDLGRNDVGRVAVPGSIRLPEIMTVEHYSHVMHISSTVTGRLAPGMTCWDAMRHALPVGTLSGAPKVRAMQIIDEMEPTRRGPYAGGVGVADLLGNLNMAITLRTMVVQPTDRGVWSVHVQAGGGIVADSDPEAEHQETVHKAAALAKAIDLAERAFAGEKAPPPETGDDGQGEAADRAPAASPGPGSVPNQP